MCCISVFLANKHDSLGSDFDLRHVFREGDPRGAGRIAHLPTAEVWLHNRDCRYGIKTKHSSHKSWKWKMWPWNIKVSKSRDTSWYFRALVQQCHAFWKPVLTDSRTPCTSGIAHPCNTSYPQLRKLLEKMQQEAQRSGSSMKYMNTVRLCINSIILLTSSASSCTNII